LSPEAIYRALSPENGFFVKTVYLHELSVTGGAWYRVADTAHGTWLRGELINTRPTYICCIAERVVEKQVFAAYPQQSYYVEAWERGLYPQPESARRSIRQMIPRPVKTLVRTVLDTVTSLFPFNRPYYRYISADDVVHGRIKDADFAFKRE
jgi:hypothetical protein